MARESGQYRKMLLEQKKSNRTYRVHTDNKEELRFFWVRTRFYIGLVLFVCFVLLDYTGFSIKNVTSQQILAVIREDRTSDMGFASVFAELTDQISMLKEE